MGFRVTALRILRVVVWALVALLLIRGIVSLFPPPPQPASPLPPPAATKADEEREGPGAFAALFAREYLTWQAGKESEHAARVKPLLARTLDAQAGWSQGAKPLDQVADATWPYHVAKTGEGRWLVTVAVRVTTTEPAATQSTTSTQTVTPTATPGANPTAQTANPAGNPTPPVATTQGATPAAPVVRTLYLAVPVAGGPAGYAVVDYPTFVPAPAAPDVTAAPLEGQDMTDPEGLIGQLLTGFFKAYTSGGPAEVAYYLEPGVKMNTLQGAMALKSISDLSIRRSGQDTWATAIVTVVDPVSGAGLKQRYTLQVVQRDGRWYIKQIIQKGV